MSSTTSDSVVEVFLRDKAMILAQDLSLRFCFCLATIGQETSSMIVNNKNRVSDIMRRCQKPKDH